MGGVYQVRELWPDRRLDLLGVLPVFVHSGNHATRATLEALDADPMLGASVLHPGIRQCIDLNYAAASHQSIWEYAPRSRAAEDYTKLLDHIVHGCADKNLRDDYAAHERSAAPTFTSRAASPA